MAGDEVGIVDEVGRADGPAAETQVRYGDAAGLAGVVGEIGLRIQVGVVAVSYTPLDVYKRQLRKRWRTLTTWSSPWTVSGIRLGAPCSRGNTAAAGMAGKAAGIPIRCVCQGTPVPRMIAATRTSMTSNTRSDLFRS